MSFDPSCQMSVMESYKAEGLATRTRTDSVLLQEDGVSRWQYYMGLIFLFFLCLCKTKHVNSKPHSPLMPGVLSLTKICLGWNGHLNRFWVQSSLFIMLRGSGDHMTILSGCDCIFSSQRTELNTANLLLLFQVYINKKGLLCISWKKAKLKVNIFMYFINIHVLHSQGIK